MNTPKYYLHLFAALTILGLIGTGCAVASGVAPVQTRSAPLATPTVAVIVTMTPQNTPTQVAPFHTDLSCWPIKPLQEGNDIHGSFVYSQSSDKTNVFSSWDISSFHDEKLDVNKKIDIGSSKISANGDTVVALANNNLIFISHKNIQSFPLPEKALMNNAMLAIENEYARSDGRVLISRLGRYPEIEDDYKEGIGLTYTFYKFDPVTSEISRHKLFLPDLYMDWDRVPRIYFSSDIEYALYRGTPTKDSPDRFVVYDIEKEKIVMAIPAQNSNLNVTNGLPHWLPNDNVITAEFYDKNTAKRNYYSVSLDGKISPATNLPDHISITSSLLANPLLNWSPNKRYLVSADTHLSIYVWDNQTRILYNPCLPNEQRSIAQPQPVWSFDGSYFVATLIFPSPATPIVESTSGRIVDQRIVKKYILDLINKIIYEVPENGYDKYENYRFLGWVNWEIP